MAEKREGYATDISRLRLDGVVDRAFIDNGEAMHMVIDDLVVFNRALFYLEAETEIRLAPNGTKGEPLYKTIDPISSKKYYNGVIYEAEITGADEIIEPNDTDEEKSGTWEITQRYSNFKISGTWVQEADVVVRKEFMYVHEVSIAYDGIAYANGTIVEPRVTVFYVIKEYYASGDNSTKTLETNGDITYAYGVPLNSSGATIDSETGVIKPMNLGNNPTPYQECFAINKMNGTISVTDSDGTQTHDWEWSGNEFLYQESNSVRDNGDGYYDILSAIDGYKDRIGGEAAEVGINVSAWYAQPKIWTSGYPETDYSKTYANLSTDVGTVSPTTVYGDEQAIVSIPQNGNTERVIHVNVYNSSANYDETHTITQDAYVANASWSKPTINGSIEFEIPASGNPVLFIVPVKQIKTLDGKSNTFEWDAPVVKVVGHSVESSNASFSEGYLSCDSLGKTWSEYGREAFYAERIWVIGKDGEEHEVELDSYIVVRQAQNVRVEDDRSYDISTKFDFDERTIDGDASILYVEVLSTSIYVNYTWSSGEPDSETLNTSVFLTANVGQLSTSAETARNRVSWSIPRNIGSSQRTLTLRVYNTEANYDVTYNVYQSVYVADIIWNTPILNGEVSVKIPASGAPILFTVPVKQSNTEDGKSNYFEWNAVVTKVQGHAVESSEASFDNGYLSCDSLGTNIMPEGREAYYAERIWIEGKDDKEYELELDGDIIIKQAPNIVEYDRKEYHINNSVPAHGTTIDGIGADIKILIDASYDLIETLSSDSELESTFDLPITIYSPNCVPSSSIVSGNAETTIRAQINNDQTSRILTIQLYNDEASYSETFTITQKASPYPIEVWKFDSGAVCESSKWYLGQVYTGYTKLGGVPVYHIMAATTSEYKNSDAQINARFGYAYKHSSGDYSGTYNTPVYYKGGTEITINGKIYYGVILVEELTGLKQGTVEVFNVMGGGDIT